MKKIVVIIMALAMAVCFAGCGDSGTADEGQKETAAEPNAGIEGVVYTIPDGWVLTDDSESNYAGYENPDSEFELGITAIDEEAVKSMNEQDPDGPKTVQEFYEESFSMSDQELEKTNAEADTGEVCGAEAKVLKWKNGDKGYVDIGTAWVTDGVCYDLWIVNEDAYDDEGNVKEDAAVLGEEDIAMYDGILASVAPGDGEKFRMANVSTDSIGSFKFEAPEGFSPTDASKRYVEFANEDESVTLSCTFTNEENLKNNLDENGNTYKTLKDYYNSFLYEGVETTTIGGCDGYIDTSSSEDGKVYFCNAGFMTDDGVYEINMDTDSYDSEGNLKDGAKALSEDDIAAFKQFVESFEKQ